MTQSLPVWGIHAGKFGEADPLFNAGWIALGWNEIGDLRQLSPTREAFKVVMKEADPDAKPGSIPVNAGQLYRFVHEAMAGDLIVWRPKNNPAQVRIGKITGDYKYESQPGTDYPHQRPVSWKASVEATRLT